VDEVHANFAARQRGLIRALTDGTPHAAIAIRIPARARIEVSVEDHPPVARATPHAPTPDARRLTTRTPITPRDRAQTPRNSTRSAIRTRKTCASTGTRTGRGRYSCRPRRCRPSSRNRRSGLISRAMGCRCACVARIDGHRRARDVASGRARDESFEMREIAPRAQRAANVDSRG